MKKLLITLLILTLCAPCASATILPPTGVDESFKAWTGIECTPAIVLCESLSIYDERGDQGGKKVSARYYSSDGNPMPVIESWDGWAKIYYLDGNETGWVRSDYLLMDPAWYLCDEDMQVYAYPDTMSPRVALLDKGTKLPIITQWDDGRSVNGWVCVSLRGAAGWIRKTPKDTADETWFRPEMLADIAGAVLQMGDNAVGSTDKAVLTELSRLLTNVEDKGGPMAGCPFTATLTLLLADGQKVELLLATDSCCVYRVNNRDYAYARHLYDPYEGSPENSVLFGLFGMNVEDLWAR
jgi:SH3-like domain-containing protein